MQGFEVMGSWWLPNDPSHTLPGILRVSDEGKSELELDGHMRDLYAGTETQEIDGEEVAVPTTAAIIEDGIYPRIVGAAKGTGYTLENCHQVHRSSGFTAGSVERIAVSTVFKGSIFEDGEVLEFDKVTIGLDWLAHWIDETAINHTTPRGPGEPVLEVRLIPKDQRDAQLSDGTSLALFNTYDTTDRSATHLTVNQDFAFSAVPAGLRAVDELLQVASLFQDIVTIGTCRTAAFQDVNFFHPDIRHPHHKDIREPIVMFAPFRNQSEDKVKYLNTFDMAFTFADLGKLGGVAKWLDLTSGSQLQPLVRRAMSIRYFHGMFATDRLFNIAASLERYDKIANPDGEAFLKRIERCVTYAGDPFASIVTDTEEWCENFRNYRNDVAHQNPVDPDHRAHYFYSTVGFWLFIMCLMRDMGVDHLCDKVADSREIQWVKVNLSKL